jgi:hypothetical protein
MTDLLGVVAGIPPFSISLSGNKIEKIDPCAVALLTTSLAMKDG